VSKVVIEGMLSSWRYGPEFVGISINGQTVEGDWATVSGRRVRVTVELAPEPESEPESRCPHCGGRAIFDTRVCTGKSPYDAWEVTYIAKCRGCGAYGEGETHQAALDALKAWQPTPKCPFCGGDVWDIWVSRENVKRVGVACSKCDAHGEGPTRQAALDALAEWLDVCPRCGGRAEYGGERRYFIECTNPECVLSSPLFDTKRAAAQWWDKREGRK